MVTIDPCLKPKVSRMTFTIGTRQFVVHDALEMMVCFDESYLSLLTPMTMVMSSPLAGAEISTFFAPHSMCFRAALASVKRPVDSRTISTPRSFHGRAPHLTSNSSKPVDAKPRRHSVHSIRLKPVAARMGPAESHVTDYSCARSIQNLRAAIERRRGRHDIIHHYDVRPAQFRAVSLADAKRTCN